MALSLFGTAVLSRKANLQRDKISEALQSRFCSFVPNLQTAIIPLKYQTCFFLEISWRFLPCPHTPPSPTPYKTRRMPRGKKATARAKMRHPPRGARFDASTPLSGSGTSSPRGGLRGTSLCLCLQRTLYPSTNANVCCCYGYRIHSTRRGFQY